MKRLLAFVFFTFFTGFFGQAQSLVVQENSTGAVDGDARLSSLAGSTWGFSIRPYDASFNGGTWNWEKDFGYKEDTKQWYVEGGFRIVRGNVAVGSWDSYEHAQLDVTGSHTAGKYDAQLHLHTSNSPYGMFMGSHAANYGVISQGGHYQNSGAFMARATEVSGVIQTQGHLFFFSNSGLTEGNTFTPSKKMSILNNGHVGVGTTPQARLDVKGDGNAYSFEHFIVRDMYNNKDFVIRGDGSVMIGYEVDVPQGFKLGVAGKLITEEVVVKLRPWPDYVFEADYPLTPLQDLEIYLKENKHLPGIPTAKEAAEEGIKLGEMNAKLLEKVEELTLYIIELNKENDQLKAGMLEIENMKNDIKKLQEALKSK